MVVRAIDGLATFVTGPRTISRSGSSRLPSMMTRTTTAGSRWSTSAAMPWWSEAGIDSTFLQIVYVSLTMMGQR